MTEAQIEEIAKQFHYAYERLAHEHGHRTRPESRTGWENVPDNIRRLLMATVRSLIIDEIILPGVKA